MDDTSSLRAVAAYDAVKNLLKLLQDKGLITSQEAFGVLEHSVDDAEDNLTEIQNETDVQS